MAGSAILAIAVSRDAIATAAKIAVSAQPLRPGGRPSVAGVAVTRVAIFPSSIRAESPAGSKVPRFAAGCTMERTLSPPALLHDAYAVARHGEERQRRSR